MKPRIVQVLVNAPADRWTKANTLLQPKGRINMPTVGIRKQRKLTNWLADVFRNRNRIGLLVLLASRRSRKDVFDKLRAEARGASEDVRSRWTQMTEHVAEKSKLVWRKVDSGRTSWPEGTKVTVQFGSFSPIWINRE